MKKQLGRVAEFVEIRGRRNLRGTCNHPPAGGIRMIPDRDRDEWVRLEVEGNPLRICTRPQVLRSARRTC